MTSRLRRAAHGLRYVRCACGLVAYSETANAPFWSTSPEGGKVYVECVCGRHHEVTRHKPLGEGWRRPLLSYRELAGMPPWAQAIKAGDEWLASRESYMPPEWGL
jgi:hypothetical protein